MKGKQARIKESNNGEDGRALNAHACIASFISVSLKVTVQSGMFIDYSRAKQILCLTNLGSRGDL